MKSTYWLTRLYYIRGLGVLYILLGLILWIQGPALIGPGGLTPIPDIGAVGDNFWKFPSLLFYSSSITTLKVMAGTMIFFGAILVAGFCNWFLIIILWLCQLSLVNGAGRFWSFGWETMMLEMTLLSLFFVHPWRLRLMSEKNWIPTYFSFVPLLWMCFRLLFGAGLIKIRGDACWLDLTCMDYHYQTQPNPHFLSWYFHHLPWWFHRFEIFMTHFYELLVPFLFLLIRPLRRIGALLIILFQFTLISTGNLAFLNWQTMILVLVGLDDGFIEKFRFWSNSKLKIIQRKKMKPPQLVFTGLGLVVVILLSYKPTMNMISPQQRMNESYDGFHLINSYGLFGRITKKRYEVIISGTRDSSITNQTEWQEYEFYCKPGDVNRKPCWITPYHLRLDWQMWFSAMRPKIGENWLMNLAKMMLKNDDNLKTLIQINPFAGGDAPTFVKMDLYLYEFSDGLTSPWWKRQYVQPYMPPVTFKK